MDKNNAVRAIVECPKKETIEALKKWISLYRPCSYFVASSSDEAINNGYQGIIKEHNTDFSKNNLIIIKSEL